MNKPYNFLDREIQSYFNIQPSQVKGRFNNATEYYKRFLYTKLYSVFEFNLPADWKLNFFRFWLFRYGSIAVIYTNKFGWIAQPYSVLEHDLYYNPKKIQVYNQFIKDAKVGVIGVNAGVVNIMDDFFGLDDLITKYAAKLASCDKAIDVSLMNSNVSIVFEADSKKQAEELKEAYGKATTGEPLIAINKDVMNGKSLATLIPNVKNNMIANEVLDARRTIVNEFLTEIGINNANVDKRERLNSDEVNANNEETKAIVSVILDNIRKGFETINNISGLDLSVNLRYNASEEV